LTVGQNAACDFTWGRCVPFSGDTCNPANSTIYCSDNNLILACISFGHYPQPLQIDCDDLDEFFFGDGKSKTFCSNTAQECLGSEWSICDGDWYGCQPWLECIIPLNPAGFPENLKDFIVSLNSYGLGLCIDLSP